MSDHPTVKVTGRYWRLYPTHQPLGHAEEALELLVDETVFLLVDVYGAVGEDGTPIPDHIPDMYVPSGNDPKQAMVRDLIAPAKAAAKQAGLKVVYVTNYLSPGLSEGNEWRNMSMRTCDVDVLDVWQPPTPILEHPQIITPEDDEPVVKKQHYSGFFETNLDSVLRGYGAKNLVTVGFDSRICLGMTLVDALYRDYRVVALRDAIRTSEYPETDEGQWANFLAVRFIESNVGYTATTDEFIAACQALTPAQAQV